MPRNPPTDRISASIWLPLMAMSVISPTASSFWLWTLRPFNFEENISSFDTVENLASAGAVPVVLASSAKTGLASKASDAASSAIFFIVSSSIAELQLYNARPKQTFRDLIGEHSGCDAAGFVGKPRQQRLCRVRRQHGRERDDR